VDHHAAGRLGSRQEARDDHSKIHG
jgi:hypothetical protein